MVVTLQKREAVHSSRTEATSHLFLHPEHRTSWLVGGMHSVQVCYRMDGSHSGRGTCLAAGERASLLTLSPMLPPPPPTGQSFLGDSFLCQPGQALVQGFNQTQI